MNKSPVIDSELVKMAIQAVDETWDAIAYDYMMCCDDKLSSTFHAREVVEITLDYMFTYASPDNKAAYDLVEEECQSHNLHAVSYIAAEMPHGLYGY